MARRYRAAYAEGLGVSVDPLSAAALGGAVLTRGIGFLYDQLGELLRRRRDRKPSSDARPVEIPRAGEAEQVLAGQLAAGPVDERALDQYADQLAKLWGLLAPYAAGLMSADPSDRQLVEQLEVVRRVLEQVYQQHITFAGEQRPATGTPLDVKDAGEAGQYAALVIASGERAVATGRDITGTVITGAQASPDRNPVDQPPSE